MERGKQYIRAIQLYYRKFQAYPPNIDALVKTSEIRFLRKKYIDPMTGKDDWKPIRFGQNKTPTAMGFFGQPLPGAGSAGGSVVAGIGPSGGNGINGGSAFGGPGSSSGSSSIFGSGNSGAGSGSSTPTAGSPTGSSGGVGSTGSTSSTGSSGSDTGLSGQTFGGAGIIGFSPASPGQSILIYKKKNHYNEWEFVYDPLTDMRTVSGNSGNHRSACQQHQHTDWRFRLWLWNRHRPGLRFRLRFHPVPTGYASSPTAIARAPGSAPTGAKHKRPVPGRGRAFCAREPNRNSVVTR